ncbi:helix-turn-helix domain-containing protein, partial [Actinomyces sp.]|uniref:helix-turn-helix domain-containing protein n=1 Tax=Actinomyces sp. TaxID=29317 RepID=UPI0029126D7E
MNTLVKQQTSYSLNDIVTVNISMYLGSLGITQTELAELLGIRQASVNRRLQGQTEWRLSDIEAIAVSLGIPSARLLTEPEEMDAIMRHKLNKHPADGSHRLGALARSKGFEPPTF